MFLHPPRTRHHKASSTPPNRWDYLMKQKTMDAPPQGEHHLLREASPEVRKDSVTYARDGRGPRGRLDRHERQVRLVAACLVDLVRLLKQEGWVDVLDDEFDFSAPGPDRSDNR